MLRYTIYMISRYNHKDLVWVDIESPTKEDILSVAGEFSLHPLVSEELLSPTMRPKIDVHDNSIFLVLHFPAFHHTYKKEVRQEVDFIVGQKFLITVHYDTVDAIHKFSKEFEVKSILNKHEFDQHAGFLFFQLVKKLYRSLEHELEYIEDRLKHAEMSVFKGEEYKMVTVLSDINRDLLDLKQALRTHKDVLRSLEAAGTKFFGMEFTYYLQAISGEFSKVDNNLDGQKETLIDLRDTNDSLLAHKTTGAMKTLTMVSFSTFPLMLISSVFAMRTENTPFIGMKFDFWFVLAIMAITLLLTLAYFVHKKWL